MFKFFRVVTTAFILTLSIVSHSACAADRLDINTATTEQIADVEGVGYILAKKIVALREKLGKITNVVEFMTVEGMSTDLASSLQPKLEKDGSFTINKIEPEDIEMEIFEAPVY